MTSVRVVRLDTWRTRARLAVGLLICIALVAGLVVAAVGADRTKTAVAAWVGAALVGLLTAFIAIGGWYAQRRRALIVSADGIAYDSKGRPWRVGWAELAQARVEYGWRPAGPGLWFGKNWSVRLVLVPAEPASFRVAHPELKVFDGRFASEGYGFPLGPARELVEPIAAGLREFGGADNGGVVELGRIRKGALL